ncbi:hypothetical protein ACIHDR_48265 [Nocardia sp. NPDC052278]|uniref:hypothetical protein n=1 Tax=unclassified Nocardia TaxID=2637762 RepID=UPI0036B41C72
MSDGPMRVLKPPQRVRVDPRRIWGAPQHDWPRTMPPTLGEKAASLDIRTGEEWITATAYRWARLARGTTPTWYLEIELDLLTINGLSGVTLRQWVPWDAVQPILIATRQ